MTRLGAYREVPAFAYPGWRLTVPGGPAGGHSKGFTHTQAAGTDIAPQDEYEMDREDGMSSHDAVHASPRNPRGVYRSPAEVPPRPNASGSAHTYRGLQTERHAGTSVAPGSYPADFFETGEDDFISLAQGAGRQLLNPSSLVERAIGIGDYRRPNTVGAVPIDTVIRATPILNYGGPVPYHGPLLPSGSPTVSSGCHTSLTPGAPGYGPGWECVNGEWVAVGDAAPVAPFPSLPSTGATSVVNQPAGSLAPAPPSPSVPVYTAPPVSPAPAPTVATNEVIPLNDGSGNYLNVSTGQIIPASAVAQNLATMQLTAPSSSALNWLEQPSSFFPSIPNWGLLAAAAAGAALLMGKRR